MNKLRLSIGIAVLACAFGATRAFANEGQGGACREDAQRLCGDVKPGGGNIHDCMKAHEGELSSDCKASMQKHKDRMDKSMKATKAACAADLKQYCSNVTPGEGREFACLKAYEDKISAGCKEAMHKGREGMMKRHDMKHKEKTSEEKPH